MKKLVALILALTLVTGCGGLRGNSRSFRIDQETEYLTKQSHGILTSDTQYMADQLERQASGRNIILTGVVPGVSGNAELLKYFYEAIDGVRQIDYLVVELPYSAGEMLNTYLRSRDEKSLKQVFQALEGTPYASEENRSFFRQLKLLLKDKNESVKIVGVDIEYLPELSLSYLSTLFSGYDAEAFPAARELAAAYEMGFTQPDYLELTFKSLYEDMQADPESASSAFGTDYMRVLNVLENLVTAYDNISNSSNEHFNHERSDSMVKNFLKVYDKAPDAMYLGQLSNPAVMQSNHLSYDWFASAIQKARKSVEGNVLSLLYTYENCKRMVYLDGKYEVEILDLFKFDEKKVLDAIDQTYTLISMIEKDTLFTEDAVIFEKDFDGPVSDYFQYLIVVNKSPASRPISE